MPNLLWDASALAKRYVQESGSDTVQALFTAVPMSQMVTTIWGYAETFSILLRLRNHRVLSASTFLASTYSLKHEIIDNPDIGILTVDDAAVLSGISLMQKHNLNSTDAAILAIFLRYVQSPDAPVCVLVAADRRLVRSAQAEGLATINPENLLAADVPAFLATL